MPKRFLQTSPRDLFGLLIVVAFGAMVYVLRKHYTE
jgi:hypothetical protein